MRKKIGKIKNSSLAKRYRRKLKIRKIVIGSTERPRICVGKTNKNLFVQAIDDSTHKTLFSVQTFGKNAVAGAKGNKEGAKLLGAKIAENLKANKIETAVFDRAGHKYHGVLAALVEGIKENGVSI
ncbi:MAG: 50S ribosomal protein L18 [Epsilonproteobacteria bacterium]|nr:MAG: 50S ribosomal protein L18 [Campylobacterota bacterium]RLA66501.1 MAG: 50S ribosomal protein L18 [Campylobacterota bacterium]